MQNLCHVTAPIIFLGCSKQKQLNTKISLRKSNLLFFLTNDITQKYDPTLFVKTKLFALLLGFRKYENQFLSSKIKNHKPS